DAERNLLPALCSKDRLSLDVGANWGSYTLAMLRQSANVIAFEPIPRMAGFLRRVFENRGTVNEKGLSDSVGISALSIKGDRGAESKLTPGESRKQSCIEVRMDTLDHLSPMRVGF